LLISSRCVVVGADENATGGEEAADGSNLVTEGVWLAANNDNDGDFIERPVIVITVAGSLSPVNISSTTASVDLDIGGGGHG
jgi:hypothetical protein